MEESKSKSLAIIHYNDVYELRGTEKDLCGGADRFCYLVNEIKKQHNAIVLFSGDLWNPSKLGTTMKGEQMVKAVNKIDTKAACVGNHDLVKKSYAGSWRRPGNCAYQQMHFPLALEQRQDGRWICYSQLKRL